MKDLKGINKGLLGAIMELSDIDFDPFEALTEGVRDPYIFKAIFMAGSPGSGKSFAADHLAKGMGVKFVNSDVHLERMLTQKGLPMKMDSNRPQVYAKQMATREQAKKITKKFKAMWLKGMHGLLIDGTAKNYSKLVMKADKLRAAGYDVGMVFVNAPLEVALKQNASRERVLDDELVNKFWGDVQVNKSKFQSYFGSGNFFEVEKKGTLRGKEEDAFAVAMRRYGMKWYRKAVQNPIGRNIISTLQSTGGTTLGDLASATVKAANENLDFLNELILD